MKRKLPLVALVGFLVYTGAYMFVYLWRAFRIRTTAATRPVLIWHGDPFARAIFVAILFLIGLVTLVYVAMARSHGFRAGQVQLRQDLWQWLVRESEETNESPSRLAERAVVAYRARMEGPRAR